MRLLALAPAIFGFVCSGSAVAQTRIEGLASQPAPQLVIFIVRGPGVPTPLVAFQERARSAVETHMHVRVLSMDETLARGGAEFRTSLAECRGDPTCLSRLVGKVEAQLLLVITATVLGETRIVGSRLIDLGALSVLGEAVDAVPDDGNVLDAVAERIERSIPRELWDPFGSLSIGVNEPGAQIRVNGRVVGMSPISPLGYLTPGEYKVEAVKEGFRIASAGAVIERGREARVDLGLEEESGSPGWLLWLGIGLAIAGGAAAAAIAVSSGGEDPTFCTAVRPELCP